MRLSIQISVTSGGSLRQTLQLLNQMASPEVEVVVVNSGGGRAVSELCRAFGAHEIAETCGLLKSRFLGLINSSGEYCLILDETRVPSVQLINYILENPASMMVIPEIQSGTGIVNWLDSIDKRLTLESSVADSAIESKVVPRLYSCALLRATFQNIRGNLGSRLFEQVVAKDDRIIFIEAARHSTESARVAPIPLYHVNRTNLLLEIRKYQRYGLTSRLLIGTPYEPLLHLSGRVRRLDSIWDSPVLILYALRAISYLFGLYVLGGRPNPCSTRALTPPPP